MRRVGLALHHAVLMFTLFGFATVAASTAGALALNLLGHVVGFKLQRIFRYSDFQFRLRPDGLVT